MTWPRALLMLLVAVLSAGCRQSGDKLDEALLHQRGALTIRLVRYYERLSWHYDGEVFQVHCSSPATAGVPAQPMQPAGWVTIGSGPAIGSKSAEELARRDRHRYLVFDEQTAAWWPNVAFHVSYDGCATSLRWSPTSLPESMIDVRPKPPHCGPGGADCRHYDFMAERAPRYESVAVRGDAVSFVVRTPALRAGSLRVTSADRGATWHVAP